MFAQAVFLELSYQIIYVLHKNALTIVFNILAHQSASYALMDSILLEIFVKQVTVKASTLILLANSALLDLQLLLMVTVFLLNVQQASSSRTLTVSLLTVWIIQMEIVINVFQDLYLNFLDVLLIVVFHSINNMFVFNAVQDSI